MKKEDLTNHKTLSDKATKIKLSTTDGEIEIVLPKTLADQVT